MATPPPLQGPAWTNDEDATLRRLHGESRSLHSIAAEMGRHKSTVSIHAKKLGLVWDRRRTAAASEAVAVDNKARRVAIVARLYGQTEAELTDLENGRAGRGWRTVLKGSFGVEETKTLTFVPPVDRRTVAEALSRLLLSAAKLEAIDATDGVERERSLLTQLGQALGVTGPGQ